MKQSFKPGTAIVFEPTWSESKVKGGVPYTNKKTGEKHPLTYGEIVYFLTDIPNVGGHCIITTWKGLVVPMLHPGDFRKAKDNEL